MGDAALDEIRQRRMMELMAKQEGGGMGGGGMSAQQMQEQEEKSRAQDDQRHSMMVAIVTPEARERLNRIALVKPDKAKAVEAMILSAAQRGQIKEKITDERLMSMLEQISEREGSSKPRATVERRRRNMDNDDDW